MPLETTNYTWNGESAREAIMVPIVENTKLEQTAKIVEGVKAKQQIVYFGELEGITHLDPGCGLGAEEVQIPLTEDSWDPSELKIWLKECWTNTRDTLFEWAQKNGIDRADLTETSYLDMILERVEQALPRDAFAIGWFADKDIANVSAAGTLTNGVNVNRFNQIDGLWKHTFAKVPTTSAHYVEIPENALATRALQMALATDRAVNVFTALTEGSEIDGRLTGDTEAVILATRSLVMNYKAYLRNNFPAIDAAYQRIEGGFSEMTFGGIKIIEVADWDHIIRTNFNNGTTLDLPHRAIYTTLENLQIGVDSSDKMNELKVWYDDNTELNNIKGGYKMDAKVPFEFMIAAAY